MNKVVVFFVAAVVAATTALYHLRYDYTRFSARDVNRPIEAIFYIAPGYVDGLDSTPIVSAKDNGTILTTADKEIYLDPNRVEEIEQVGHMPACTKSRPTIRVQANVTMTTTSGWGPNVPGADARYPVEYYVLKLNKLRGVTIQAEPCAP